MNCPYCQTKLSLCPPSYFSTYDCIKDDHQFFYYPDAEFFYLIMNEFEIGHNHNDLNYYILTPKNRVIKIQPFSVEKCKSVLDSYLKLQAFL